VSECDARCGQVKYLAYSALVTRKSGIFVLARIGSVSHTENQKTETKAKTQSRIVGLFCVFLSLKCILEWEISGVRAGGGNSFILS
jgi:hypothetical protein